MYAVIKFLTEGFSIKHLISQLMTVVATPQWRWPLIIALSCSLLFVGQSLSLPLLEYDRGLIAQGQVWRILTGNFLHTNSWHLLMNLVGLVLLTQLFGRHYSQWQFCLFTLTNCVMVGALLYWFTPDIYYYVGLSGYLHGLFVFGCLDEINRGIKFSYLLLLGIAAKVFHEQFYGAAAEISALINAEVAVDAHWYGAITAVPIYALYLGWQRLTRQQ
ncbi:MAG: rhombosortase [Gammaproteobacteria bacterium]|nr:rhombosortase [Gammaproteobacteria bacterium]